MKSNLLPYLLTWSADSQKALSNKLLAWQQSEENQASLISSSKQLWKRYDPGEQCRLILIVTQSDDKQLLISQTVEALSQPDGSIVSENIFLGTQRMAGRCAFLFPGQGSQYPHMLAELAPLFPEIKAAFSLGNSVTQTRFEKPLSTFVFPDKQIDEHDAKLQLRNTHVAQPALGCASLGMLHVLRKFGVIPDVVAGHSYGEYVALYAAEAIDSETLIHLSEVRGRYMAEESNEDSGTMLAVKAGVETIQPILGSDIEVVFANLNAPNQTVLSGSILGIEQAETRLTDAKIRNQRLNVSAAFHSPLMESAQRKFTTYLNQITFSEPQRLVYANVSAKPYRETDEIDQILCGHLTSPVLFAEMIEQMYTDGVRLFLEVGPHNVLTSLTKKILRGKKEYHALATNHIRHPDQDYLFRTIARMMAMGIPIDLSFLYEELGTDSSL